MKRNIFKSYLKKVQELQVLAYEHGLNFELTVREAGTENAWIVGYVYTEETHFLPERRGLDFINITFYDHDPAEEWDKELLRIKEWIINHNNL